MSRNSFQSSDEIYTIPQLADRIGVSATSVRNWYKSGRIDPPEVIPATGEKFYSGKAADQIERDYMIRAARGGTRGPGAKARRARAKAWIEKHGIDPTGNGEEPKAELAVAALPENCPAAIVDKAVRRWLVLEDHLLPTIPLVIAVANRLPGPPVWLMIVAPPSSGKSEVIRGLNSLDGVYHISSLTSSTFASGMLPTTGSDETPSLLKRMEEREQWLLTLKDFGTIQSVQRETRNEIFGQLREIYDGQFSATYGTGVEIDWNGKLGMLVGATPAVDRQYKWSAELGERFVQFRPLASDPEEVSRRAVQATEMEQGKNREIKAAYGSGFRQAQERIAELEDGGLPLAEHQEEMVAALARFTAEARRPVRHRRGGGYEVLSPEGPARLAKVFAQLYKTGLICFADDERLALRLVARVAVDCVPGRRGKLLRTLAEKNSEGVTATGMATRLGCDTETARTELNDFCAIGLAESNTPASAMIFRASAKLKEAAHEVYTKAKNGEQALEILCDRGIHRSPEREKETNSVGETDE